ncbi:MAG: porphobilinogen synthase [Cytophagaceae bacterium]|nr:porphobilinogen synthase [Gemmatimonadaceae bacterium]
MSRTPAEVPEAARDDVLQRRPRRLRASLPLRSLVRETRLDRECLVQPFFVAADIDAPAEIASMPGQWRHPVRGVVEASSPTVDAGVGSVLVFGIPTVKDERGVTAADPGGPVPRAITELKSRYPRLVVIADVCLCEYTTHGHCGIVHGTAVDNDETLPLLARAAVAYADAGADIVAPSAMMDGQVGTIRAALDASGHSNVAIMSYAAKYASAFYGPFREAAGSTPAFGDRRAYQMDAGNAREALTEMALDMDEGADILMVKPAGAYLDIIRSARDAFPAPIAAYQVSGEYSMIKAAAARGWLDERGAALESLTAIRRAGADIIISYYATDVATWLEESR